MQLILVASILATLTQSWVVSAKPTGLIEKRANPSLPTTCDISKAKLPVAPSPLPPPSPGSTLTHVVVGRGTQNYTCADNTANTKPVQVGALAKLFNATCVAGQYPQLLAMLPGIAAKFPTPAADTGAGNLFLSGVHYFTDTTTPFFDFNTPAHKWGTAHCSKTAASNAPNPTKDVPWLKLSAKSATDCSINEVYRVNTVGGVAPATCQGQPASIQVDYATEYWFYSGPGSY